MALTPCITPGCPTPSPRTRCEPCERGLDQARGTRQQRGYDATYDAAGRGYQRRMNDGEHFDCWRCHKPITGTRRGIDWMLGHNDLDRSEINGPEHPGCNLATNGRH